MHEKLTDIADVQTDTTIESAGVENEGGAPAGGEQGGEE
jgi:hypothetical protein